MDTLTKLVLEQLDIKTIRSIQKQCVNYITYSVDFKQIVNRYGTQLKVKEIAELQEYCNYLLIIKQAYIEEEKEKTTENKELKKEANASDCENIKSTMAEDTDAMSKKKEKKK